MARKVNLKTIQLIEEFEGYEKELSNGSCMAYLDTLANKRSWSPGYNGLWTIGWGSTGPDITEGTIWTRNYAEKRLWDEVNKKAAEVEAYLTYTVNDNQFGALVSLAYNIGTAGIHGILNLVNAGDLDAAANAFPNYNHSDGRVIAGLTRRRLAEQELFEWEVPSEVSSLSSGVSASNAGQTVTAASMLGGYLTWDNLTQAKQFTNDHAGWILLCFGVILFVMFKLFSNHLVGAFNKGTYAPEGTKPVRAIPDEIANAPIVPTRNLIASNENVVTATPVSEAA